MEAINKSGVFNDIHDIQVQDMKAPNLSEEAVIIKVEKAGICGTDLHIYHSALGGLIPKGSVLGHEFCGELTEVGDSVSELKTGDRVVVNPWASALGLGGVAGGFSNYVKVDQAQLNQNVFKLPENVSSEAGALVEPLTVGLAAINATGIRENENALVTGCGTIGLVTIAGLKSKGVENIIATDISETRLELAKKMGAKYTFNPMKDGDLKDFIIQVYGEVGNLTHTGMSPNLTLAFECTGVNAVVKETMSLMAPDGKFTLLAIYGQEMTINPNDFVYNRLQVMGSFFYKSTDFLEAIEITANGKVDLTPIVTHEYPLAELPKAFETQADASKSIKVLVDCK